MYDVSDKFKEHVKNNGYIEKSARKAVDEVARIKWSDFVLEPSKPNLISGWDIFTFTGIDKPNLIENGWDDFKPYGNIGRQQLAPMAVFDKGYTKNWCSSNVEEKSFINNSGVVRPNPDNVLTFVSDFIPVKEGDIVKTRQLTGETDDKYTRLAFYDKDKKFIDRVLVQGSLEYEFEIAGNVAFIRWSPDAKEGKYREGYKLTINEELSYWTKAWSDYPKNKLVVPAWDNMAVLKTPLENGLTRVQVWGGSDNRKIGINLGKSEDKPNITTSLFVKSSVDLEISTHAGGTFTIPASNTIRGHALNMKTWWGPSNWIIGIGVSGSYLDFTAEKPEIVEGNYPNIKVSMNQENTLMHIKTFGGNDKRKLYGTIGRFPSGSRFQQSIYIENYGDDVYVSGHTGTVERHKVETGFKGWLHFPSWVDGVSWMDFSFGAETPDKCLDFKCTLPQIVEGDVPNPELVVQTLEDGRSHVRVFGATPETKLVHKSIKGFAGEPYTLSTEIKNEGLQLQMDTNLSEQSETIRKGNNQVNIEGNLEGNNIEIKLGTE